MPTRQRVDGMLVSFITNQSSVEKWMVAEFIYLATAERHARKVDFVVKTIDLQAQPDQACAGSLLDRG